MKIRNLGTEVLSSVEVWYSVDGGEPMGGVVNTSTNVPSLSYSALASPAQWTPEDTGKYSFKVWTSNPNSNVDGRLTNDTALLQVEVFEDYEDRKILNEIFTSSTCGPCRPGNINYEEITADRTNHTTIKYQAWFPGTGDPYCTQEVRQRFAYYTSQFSVPRMEIDGGWDKNAAALTDKIYEDAASKPSFLRISAVAKNTWKNTISCDVTLEPIMDFTSTNLKLFGSVVEGKTYYNAKSNGETEFEMVMKKMMPGVNGMSIDPLAKSQVINKTLSHQFMGDYRQSADGQINSHINHTTENSIETWDDLFVVVWVQDATTKEVLQSEVVAVTNNAIEDLDERVSIFPNPAKESFNIKATSMANEVAKVQVVNVQGQTVYSADMNNGVHQINTQLWIPGVYMVSVEGANEHFSTKIVVNK